MSADDRIHRCAECGTWCYGKRPCTTCSAAEQEEAS